MAGGLLFLIPILESLGLRELLAAHPPLVEIAFPERLLVQVATRLGVREDDPLLIALGAGLSSISASPCPFVLPDCFRAMVAAREPFRIFQEPDGRIVTLDSRGRMPVAVLRDNKQVSPFERRAAIPLHHPMPHDDVALLLRAFVLGAGHICRTRARVGMRALVHQSSRFVLTRTHLDVIFDHPLADVRIRRAGLDIDPGWVPWLARVVRYHYLHGEQEAV